MNEPTRPHGEEGNNALAKKIELMAKAERLIALALHKTAKDTIDNELKDEGLCEADKMALLGVASITYAAAVIEGMAEQLPEGSVRNVIKAATVERLVPSIKLLFGGEK